MRVGCYNIPVKTNRKLFLVGMMGAGKTTVGRQLAKRLGKTFYDADREIEARTGVRVAVIFDIEGEVADLVIETGRQGIGPLLAQVLARFDEACKLSA